MITLDIASFRNQFPPFADPVTFSDQLLQLWFDNATSFMSNDANIYIPLNSQSLALYLLTAHLLAINEAANSGNPLQVIQNATEGTVTVGYVPPPTKNGFQWWLSATPYGQQLWALLQIKSAGGFYFGGSMVRSGIRKPQGYF